MIKTISTVLAVVMPDVKLIDQIITHKLAAVKTNRLPEIIDK